MFSIQFIANEKGDSSILERVGTAGEKNSNVETLLQTFHTATQIVARNVRDDINDPQLNPPQTREEVRILYLHS